MAVSVEPGPGPEGLPRAFARGGRCRAVEAILDRWPGADHLYLKGRADDGGLYILRREAATGRWTVWLYRPGGDRAGPPLTGG